MPHSKRNYDNDFKAHAVQLLLGSGKGIKTVAQEMADEIRRLRKENEYLRRQREILKKAAAILAEEPHAGIR
ncbi:MAG: transposase [Chthoniobacterales bacterium]